MSLLLLLVAPALAYSGGITARTTTGCTCHGASADATTTATFLPASTILLPGDTINVDLLVSTTNGTRTAGGLDVSATGGTLSAGTNTRASAGEITHSARTAMTSGTVTFNFNWTAPTTEGTYTLRGAGNAVNANGANSGDGWNFASDVILTVDDGCNDADGDGYEDCADDCNDGDATIHPLADEHCDGVDEDCDGTVDESPVDGTTWYGDTDADGYFGDTAVQVACSSPGAAWGTVDLDCDDTRAAINPDGTETCNGWDDDCDGTIDEAEAADAVDWYRDNDLDGYGDTDLTMAACDPPTGYVEDGTDCDDTNAGVNPAADEVCDAGATDEDCDGLVDDGDPGVTETLTWYLDADLDGYGTSTWVQACLSPVGYAADGGDCDDASTEYHPGATEVCGDGRDLNCDGLIGTIDADGDGYAACEECNDDDSAISPAAVEACNAYDDDCDGETDEGEAVGSSTWYADIDGDGYGDAATVQLACAAPEGFVNNAEDCLDSDPDVHPGAVEIWYDDLDQNCDGNDDDQDGDTFAADVDCDDVNADIFPGASDAWYDGIDSNCAADSDFDADADGVDSASYGGTDCDDARADTYPGAPDDPYDGVVTDCNPDDEYDVDGDGYDHPTDCDDANSAIHPDATEVWYDGVDQDCDGNDTDQDGDGTPTAKDCDDTDPTVAADCGEDTGETGDSGDSGETGETGVDTADTDADPDTAGGDDKSEGCGCASDAAPAWGWGVALLAAAALGRRSRVRS